MCDLERGGLGAYVENFLVPKAGQFPASSNLLCSPLPENRREKRKREGKSRRSGLLSASFMETAIFKFIKASG